MSRVTIIIGRRLAIADIHSTVPRFTPSSHSRRAVSPMNGSRALIRLAASCGTNNFLCTACEGSSAVARA